MPALTNEQEALKCLRDIIRDMSSLRDIIRDMSKDIERLKAEKLEAEALASHAKDNADYWHDKHRNFVRQTKAGRASFKSTIRRLVADRRWLRKRASLASALIAFWDENAQYLDVYYAPQVREEYEALKKDFL